MIAEILSTGDEIRSGALTDTNSAFISERLEEAGIEVQRHNCVGDNLNILASVIKEISGRADISIVTGGLGPTSDDISAAAAATAAEVNLVLYKKALINIEGFFQKLKRPMSDSNKKQAMLPEGSVCLHNPVGTAPGFSLKIGKCLFCFLPGVPFEMKKMLLEKVLPLIYKLQGPDKKYCLIKTVSTFGLPESVVGEKVMNITARFPGIKLGIRSKFPEIQVKLYARGEDETRLKELLDHAARWVVLKTGKYVFSLEGSPMESVVGGLLNEKKITLAVAESCTGGLLANWLTNVPGSSDYFLFSGVTYSNNAKIKVLGVSSGTLKRYGAVHEKTAREMAEGARQISGATYGLATSGIAGPGGGTVDKPVGTVCIGIATPEYSKGRRFHFTFGRRLMNKKIFAMAALDLLRKELEKETS